MPLVVVDTSIALPATLSRRGGLTSKFWLVLAYGALSYREQHLRLELDALEHEAVEGGEIGGRAALDKTISHTRERRAALAGLLPHGTPSDWVAAGFAYLFDEYERKAMEVGERVGREVNRAEAAMLRRQFQAICVAGPEPFDPREVPALTRDPSDDPIVYAALRVGADLLVADDKDIVPRDAEGAQLYEHEGRSVLAVTFARLLQDHLDDVDWNAIDPAWLAQTYSPRSG